MRGVTTVSTFALILAALAPSAAQDAADGDAVDTGVSELDFLSRRAEDPLIGAMQETAREPVSVTLRALDKVTARYTDIEVPMNEIALFGSLELQPRYCDKRPPEEFPETTAFLEIFDKEFGNRKSDFKTDLADEGEAEPAAAPDPQVEAAMAEILTPGAADAAAAAAALEGPKASGENIFRGWMFASSPALNPLEHPVYDVWVIDCKTEVASN